MLYPTVVQGVHAVPSILKNLDLVEQSDADVVIIGRGGGSIEDLWAFNEEPVVRRVASFSLPIISSVGHETDTTLADFVADRRAATPTAAAELGNACDQVGPAQSFAEAGRADGNRYAQPPSI